MSERLEFTITFHSDFHVGAGHGLGLQVDSALLRDPDNIPVIRGTVITGLLRDSLRKLLQLKPLSGYCRCKASGAQDGNAYCNASDPCPVCAIFGSPQSPKQWSISSARPVGLEAPQQQRNKWKAGETGALVGTRVRVNPRTRRAEENKLFTREAGDGSMQFHFVATYRDDEPSAVAHAAWLLAAARFMRNLGASKRRGLGECSIHLHNAQEEQRLLDTFEQILKGQLPTQPSSPNTAPQRITLPEHTGEQPYRVQVLIRADEPLLIARRAEAGNQFETIESIPGGVLRGALAWRVVHHAGQTFDAQDGDSFRNFVQLFFRDAVAFSPLVPVQLGTHAFQGYATIPAPRDLVTCELHPGYAVQSKDEGHGVWSRAWDDDMLQFCPVCRKEAEEQGRPDPETRLETVSGFLPLNSAGLTTKFSPKQSVEMHIRLDPQTGRVQSGDLFGYVALEPGQFFVGEVTCANAEVWKALQQAAGVKALGQMNELRLGKASRRGYGRVSVVFREAQAAPWHGPELSQRITDPRKVVLTFISDAIIADPWGRFVQGFEEGWLRRELELPADVSLQLEPERCFSAVRAVDSFNAKLGLPRTRDMALVAGSSARLTFTGIKPDALRELLKTAELRGLGLRRDEGYGRVVFNHPIYQHLQSWTVPALDLRPLHLGQAADNHEAAKMSTFVEDWRQELANERWNWQEFGRTSKHAQRFEAVARRLHTTSLTSAAAIRDELNAFGKPETLLPQQVLREVAPGRTKTNFYQQDGKHGMDQIITLLEALETSLDQDNSSNEVRHQRWRTGLRMLADRISAETRPQLQAGDV